jgi:long-chain fatty acid transport protein
LPQPFAVNEEKCQFEETMRKIRTEITFACLLMAFCISAQARPYSAFTGLTASADSAQSAASNPAGITRLDNRTVEAEILWFSSESTWESQIGDSDAIRSSKDSGETLIPRVFFVEPLNDQFYFSFTFLGAGFSEDFGNWPGRYIIKEYNSVYVSAYPSLAYKINDRWSVAGSVAITYSSFEQERAVRNIFDPGFGDGKSEIETDSVEFGYGLSALYQHSDRTRFGLSYQSEIEPEQEGDNDLSGLGPNTSLALDQLGLLNADITVESTSPQSVRVGMYHEFEDNSAFTVDVAWIDFSNFVLSEFYFNGEAFAETETDYDDIYALMANYNWPIGDRWMMGVNAMATNEMVDDDERTMTLRLDAIWSLGLSTEWRWTDTRTVNLAVSYMQLGDAPVSSAEIPGFGSVNGEYDERYAFLFQFSTSWDL